MNKQSKFLNYINKNPIIYSIVVIFTMLFAIIAVSIITMPTFFINKNI